MGFPCVKKILVTHKREVQKEDKNKNKILLITCEVKEQQIMPSIKKISRI